MRNWQIVQTPATHSKHRSLEKNARSMTKETPRNVGHCARPSAAPVPKNYSTPAAPKLKPANRHRTRSLRTHRSRRTHRRRRTRPAHRERTRVPARSKLREQESAPAYPHQRLHRLRAPRSRLAKHPQKPDPQPQPRNHAEGSRSRNSSSSRSPKRAAEEAVATAGGGKRLHRRTQVPHRNHPHRPHASGRRP